MAEMDPSLDFAAGTLAGIAGLLVGHPFDTVKVRFQDPQMTGKYKSTMHALATITGEERIIGLYKGVMSPVATAAFMNGIVFASYRFFMKAQLSEESTVPTLSQIALAGAGSGIAASVIAAPTELVKIRQQQYLGADRTPTWQVAADIIRREGVRGIYRGLGVTALRDIGYGSYFWGYEATQRLLSRPAGPDMPPYLPSWMVMLISGGVAGISGWITTFPFDVIKTRMQGSLSVQSASSKQPGGCPPYGPYRTIWGTVVHSYREEGVRVFFRGLAPTLIRAVPVNMATFATLETALYAFS
ncbi:carnitine/acyl carnitine carrier [Cylindrobasidium torrendii FP15055 ss-10]|uniref:Carnitine/acyl carnitine carrier n=1 Tax=Cylindrobasidium torrendii FP15055 ss-10 TaxID=1314674 RepID=A0A0D7BAC1_9AGAR|nr:carnitine/acyl carnitine carrier [Cylindrobasidium torrendii FP15055 ss-10]